MTVPKAIQFTTTSSDPTQVADTDVFDFDIVAADVAGNPAAGYTGLILVTLTDPNGVSTSTSYYVAPDQQSHLVLKGLTLPVDGQYHLRLSDGIVASTLTINSSVKQVLPGDFNDDGKVDATDIDTLFGLIKTGDARGDLNDDGSVNQQDLDFLIHNILHTEFGDANLDGFVDTSDLAVVRKAMGSSLSGPDWAHRRLQRRRGRRRRRSGHRTWQHGLRDGFSAVSTRNRHGRDRRPDRAAGGRCDSCSSGQPSH